MTDDHGLDPSTASRRSVLRAAGAMAVGFMTGGAVESAPIVETRYGKVRGVRTGSVLSFKGVHYARAARFRPPEPPTPWVGIADASAFGPSAPQTDPHPVGPPPLILAQLPRPAGAPPPVRLPESEDCLRLNIWTAGLDGARRRPVMVWLHGGFFSGGSGSTVDGSALAGQGDVVVVSVNHRVNAFGFADLAELGGAEFAGSSNAGMLDIVAALEWIRDHAERFGGDPRRVMLFGTSGGGMKTSFLMASPRARGLFHRAAVQSGPGLRFMKRDQARTATDRLLRALGLGRSDWSSLLTMPVEQVLGGYHQVAREMPPSRFIDLPCFAPTLDEALLPRHPFSPDAAPDTRDLPMLIGSNLDEMSFFMGNDQAGFALDEGGLAERVVQIAGTAAATILDHYRAWMPATSPSQRWVRFFSDYSILLPVLAQATRKAQAGGGQTWVYRLELRSPALEGRIGATHTIETPLIFNTVEGSSALLGGRAEAFMLARRMSAAWTAFAATGQPADAAGAAWSPFEPAAQAVMTFRDDGRAVLDQHKDQDRYALLISLLRS